jgi:D-hydroxyproline dehydrogenase subunit alpha
VRDVTPHEEIACDIAVVGGGPAGIAAAARAAEAGARVVVLDEGLQLGGQIWRGGPGHDRPQLATHWLRRLERSSARTLVATAVVDAHRIRDGGITLVGESANGSCRVRAARLILATGARERFLPFPGWTLPNVVGVGGLQALLKSGSVIAGRRIVIAGSGPLLLAVAASLSANGARVVLIAEQAAPRNVRAFAAGLWRAPRLLARAAWMRAMLAPTPYRLGCWVTRADGDTQLRGVALTDGQTSFTVACDYLCTGYGLVPNIELARLLHCEHGHGAVLVDAEQHTSIGEVYAAGEPTGIGGVELALVEGQIAGLCAARRQDLALPLGSARTALGRAASRMRAAFEPRPELASLAAPDTIVCRCEDVRFGALRAGWSPRQAKLYTRVGMGPCQGRICGPALEQAFGWEPQSARPPLQPAQVSTFLAVEDSRDGSHTE